MTPRRRCPPHPTPGPTRRACAGGCSGVESDHGQLFPATPACHSRRESIRRLERPKPSLELRPRRAARQHTACVSQRPLERHTTQRAVPDGDGGSSVLSGCAVQQHQPPVISEPRDGPRGVVEHERKVRVVVGGRVEQPGASWRSRDRSRTWVTPRRQRLTASTSSGGGS